MNLSLVKLIHKFELNLEREFWCRHTWMEGPHFVSLIFVNTCKMNILQQPYQIMNRHEQSNVS